MSECMSFSSIDGSGLRHLKIIPTLNYKMDSLNYKNMEQDRTL